MIDNRSKQRALKAAGFYTGEVDGIFGSGSRRAGVEALRSQGVDATGWPLSRQDVAIGQWVLLQAGFNPGPIDGYAGSSTQIALERWQNAARDLVVPPSHIAHQSKNWPRQANMEAFYGAPGQNHTSLTLPFPMRLAWDTTKVVSRITINERCSASFAKIQGRALEHYGHARLQELGLDLFGGCYANRPMRGGKSLSTHAYACATDIDPEHNQLRWGSDRARMAKPAYSAYIDFYEDEGWVSLGRERNYDWMHFQAARF